jgi:hypothetical protein
MGKPHPICGLASLRIVIINYKYKLLKYHLPDGSVTNPKDHICDIEIDGGFLGVLGPYKKVATIVSDKDGYLIHKFNVGDFLKEGDLIYIISSNNPNTDKSEYNHLNNLGRIRIERWNVNDGDYVKEGDVLFTFKDPLSPTLGVSSLKLKNHISPKSGFIDICDYLSFSDGEIIYSIRTSDNLRVEKKYTNYFSLIEDKFDNYVKVLSKSISTSGVGRNHGVFFEGFILSLNYDKKDIISFDFEPKKFGKNELLKISFLFEGDHVLTFDLSNSAEVVINEKKYTRYYSNLLESDINCFINKEFKNYKFYFANKSLDKIGGGYGGHKSYFSKYNLCVVLKKYFTDYKLFVLENVNDYKPTSIAKNIVNIKQEECFLYLMKDTSNGFYKIGISNNPEYRERTLQSEKPTIELIVSKKFPSRKITETFEKSFHSTFSEKRIRGEWFELDNDDVNTIVMSLN